MTFSEIGLSKEVLEAVTRMGFETPMPIQEKVIPLLLNERRDLIGLAQTGTGKTAAFGLPLVDQTDISNASIQSLILCPTRELCMQITGELVNYAKNRKGLKVLAVYGGSSIETQIRELKRGVHIVVATPGRAVDLLQRKRLDLANIDTVVLDEADEMLNMGFKEDLNTILDSTPESRRTLLFSATMAGEVASIASGYMISPVEISVGRKNSGNENVNHVYCMVQSSDKYQALKRIADSEPEIYGIIFCRTRQETADIAQKLVTDKYSAEAIHGDLSQPQRDAVMKKFREGNVRLLVATDVAARGIDVNDLTHVINYSLPDDIEVYTHRSGRTGRAGKTGISVSIISTRDRYRIERLERMLKRPFEKFAVPTGKDICEKRLFSLIEKIDKTEVPMDQIAEYLPRANQMLEHLTREDLIARMVATEFSHFLEYYNSVSDISASHDRDSRPRRNERSRDDSGNFTRLFINAGFADGLKPQTLMGLMKKQMKGDAVSFGRIQILQKCAFFEVDPKAADSVIAACKNSSFDGRRIAVDFADSKPSGPRSSAPRSSSSARPSRPRRNDSKTRSA